MSTSVIVIVSESRYSPKHYLYVTDELKESFNSSSPHASWDQVAQEVRQVVLKHLDSGRDVIPLTHSFGGIAMSEAFKGLKKQYREKQGLKSPILRLVHMSAMVLPQGQSYIGQMEPGTPKEELDKQEKEMQAKYGGINV
ncbi:uncharacterized protein N7469_007627 [Penicillium citrinum]|uniref:Uncharacterized protein n=2 Tax=Penicillium TaxID=5073 RepID=A0A9W9NXF6_PENCI|nr:uncharacterized protein N7469_007627 [Penicillium citrinum]KAJ5227621.1 hypothetical protein N7469_007627 [Penicillium citrinum]KAJ5567901.1 hypothetical protein N7450_010387 [Penicillium hetheringtonii]KAK5791846.1 hypothetical protein VI817_007155 [Penicillium citrinum]